MSMELIEANEDGYTTPTSGSTSAERTFFVVDLDNDPTALDVDDFLKINIPTTFGNLLIRNFSPRRLGRGLYTVKADYGTASDTSRTQVSPTPLSTNSGQDSYVFSFSTTGGTAHITEALEQTQYTVTGTPPTLGTRVNDNGTEVEGVDIVIPAMNFTIRKRKVGAQITLAYINTLVSATGKMNTAAFLGFARGELLFTGAEGQQVRGGDTEVTFNFVAKPNLANVTRNTVSIGDVRGHDYVWTYYKPGFGEVRAASAVCKARLYDFFDFTLLGAT